MSTPPPYTLTNESITVVLEGKTHVVQKGAPHYLGLRTAILNEDWDALPGYVTVKKALHNWAQGAFSVEGDQFKLKGEPLPENINGRILAMIAENRDPAPVFKFWERLVKNPSWRSVQQLFHFLAHAHIPLTADGCFLAYKSVKHDLTDHYTGEHDNSPGRVLEMPRNKISDDPNEACHFGYHVGSFRYASTFGDHPRRLIVVKVDPEHVVCVPYDENQEKMRVCRYEVVGHHNGQPLPSTIYVDDVLDEQGEDTLEAENERVVDEQAEAEAAASNDAYVPSPTIEDEEDPNYDPEKDMLAEDCEECGNRVPCESLGVPGKWHAEHCSLYEAPPPPKEGGKVVDLMAREADEGLRAVEPDFDQKSHKEKLDTVCDECGQSAPPHKSAAHEKTCSKYKASAKKPAPKKEHKPRTAEWNPRWKAKFDRYNAKELMELSIDELRQYAGKGLKLYGASKVPGGKAGLIARILEVRK